jgi:hypothetical protein
MSGRVNANESHDQMRSNSNMRKHLKILGLSILTLTALLAISAVTAQAKWLPLTSKTSVSLVHLDAALNLSELLVPGLGLEIHCNFATGDEHMELVGGVLTTELALHFEGCFDLTFSEVCSVHSTEQKNGSLLYFGKGTASEDGSSTLTTAQSSEFTTIEYLGEECPFAEINGKITGSMTFQILNPLVDAGTHQIHLVKQALFFAGEPATLHNGSGGTLSGSFKEVNNKTWALHLVGL